jgi:hypothetical protein
MKPWKTLKLIMPDDANDYATWFRQEDSDMFEGYMFFEDCGLRRIGIKIV